MISCSVAATSTIARLSSFTTLYSHTRTVCPPPDAKGSRVLQPAQRRSPPPRQVAEPQPPPASRVGVARLRTWTRTRLPPLCGGGPSAGAGRSDGLALGAWHL